MTNPKTFLVTGAGRGIGLELTRQLVRRGDQVIATLRNAKKADRLLALEGEAKGLLHIETLDVTDPASAASLAKRLNGTPVDTLVNNAGILQDTDDSIGELNVDAVREQLETNAVGPMLVTQALLPNLRLAVSPAVVNISSLMGSIADNRSGGAYGYRMSKAALNMFAKCMSNEEPDILVVCFHPGWVKTEMGGTQATTEVHDSAAGILNVLGGLKREDTGKFFDFRGKVLPW